MDLLDLIAHSCMYVAVELLGPITHSGHPFWLKAQSAVDAMVLRVPTGRRAMPFQDPPFVAPDRSGIYEKSRAMPAMPRGSPSYAYTRSRDCFEIMLPTEMCFSI